MKKIIILLGFFGILGGSITSAFAGYFNTIPVERCDTQITQTLQIGSENDDVYVLQSMLKQGGYLYVNPNGYFGPSTKAAVKRFQNENSLSATGIVGESTRNAINERLCDSDVRGETSSYNMYGDASGVTYVDQYDPYAVVISPQVANPTVYSNPSVNSILFPQTLNNSTLVPSYNNYQTPIVNSIIPATSQIERTNIVYNPSVGYTYGITQKTGSLTIVSPVANSIYNEGDTVNLIWSTNNINASGFQILLENTSTGQSKQVAFTSNNSKNSFSFALTKELLDAVCASACNTNQQGSFRIVIATPVTDIAGITSNFRAAISPITINRPYFTTAAVSISTSKTPVNSGEKFRLYVSTPVLSSWDTTVRGDVVMKIHAVCVNAIQVSIGGVPCGQDFVMPATLVASQQGIPTMITNATWYKQDVVFEVVITNLAGQILGSARTTVSANNEPFNW